MLLKLDELLKLRVIPEQFALLVLNREHLLVCLVEDLLEFRNFVDVVLARPVFGETFKFVDFLGIFVFGGVFEGFSLVLQLVLEDLPLLLVLLVLNYQLLVD